MRTDGPLGVARAVDAKASIASTTKFIRLHRDNVNAVGIVRMHDNWEAEIGRNTIGDVGPVFGVVIGAINSPMILQEQSFRPRRMQGNLVYALSELGIFVWHEDGAYSTVLRGPVGSAIFRTVDASRRDGDVHAQFV